MPSKLSEEWAEEAKAEAIKLNKTTKPDGSKYSLREITIILTRKHSGMALRPFETNKELVREWTRRSKDAQKNLEQAANQDSYKETTEIFADGRQTSDKLIKMSEEESKDIAFLLKAHGYDEKEWEMVSARNNIWNVYSKVHGVQVLYSSKIVVKPRKDSISLQEIRESFESFSRGFNPKQFTPLKRNDSGKMAVLEIADLHYGKFAWHKETGQDYDFKIARSTFEFIVNDVLTRLKPYSIEQMLFVFTQDFFHYDTPGMETTKGTRQDADLRWQKLFTSGCEMLVETIDMMAGQMPTKTFYIASNHDKQTSFYAINYLYAWFRNDQRVEVNVDPIGRKYEEWGLNLIGFTHGDDDKKGVGYMMPIEAREAWGRTVYHEMHAAHLHSEQMTIEKNGLIVRRIASPTATDAYHYDNAYIGAVRKAQTFIYDKQLGLLDQLNTNIQP